VKKRRFLSAEQNPGLEKVCCRFHTVVSVLQAAECRYRKIKKANGNYDE
jgi:hypothetical protein